MKKECSGVLVQIMPRLVPPCRVTGPKDVDFPDTAVCAQVGRRSRSWYAAVAANRACIHPHGACRTTSQRAHGTSAPAGPRYKAFYAWMPAFATSMPSCQWPPDSRPPKCRRGTALVPATARIGLTVGAGSSAAHASLPERAPGLRCQVLLLLNTSAMAMSNPVVAISFSSSIISSVLHKPVLRFLLCWVVCHQQ